MNDLDLIIDFHLDAKRQGPGSDKQTLKALRLIGIEENAPIKIADIGCGTGAQTMVLANNTTAQIVAVDLFSQFLDRLNTQVDAHDLNGRISTLNCSMDKLPFKKEEFDVIWAEGAIYNMGFKKGIKWNSKKNYKRITGDYILL